jgi:histidinol-phosphate aminotransferase
MKNQCKEWLDEKLSEIKARENYTAEKTNETIAKQYGYSLSDIVKLNYNENLFLSKEKLVNLLKEVAQESDLRIYPQEEENRLRQKISEYIETPQDTIVIGNGSDELIDRCIRFFMQKGERAISMVPTFPIFRMCAKYRDAEYIGVPLKGDFSIDVGSVMESFTCNSRLLYLVSPNNPTANQFNQKDIETLIEEFPGIVLVDEAYGEYAGYSIVPLTKEHENLIVLRTFSKAFGLASLRLGYAIANTHLAQALRKLPDPYPVSAISLSMGRKLLENLGTVKESVQKLKREREELIKRLNQIKGIHAFNSDANFVLFTANKPSDEIYLSLLKKAIVIKNIGKILDKENCLRTTVGLPQMNTRMLETLKETLGEKT